MQTIQDKEEAPPVAVASAAAAGKEGSKLSAAAVATDRRLAIRTRFIDDFFEDCTGRRGIKQVSILFASLVEPKGSFFAVIPESDAGR